MGLIDKLNKNEHLTSRLDTLGKTLADVEFKTATINKADGEIRFIMSAEVIDRDNDIIRLDGINLIQFMKNPIMFYMHDAYRSIGHWKNLSIEDGNLVGTPVFATDSYSQDIKQQVDDGALRACSIGFVVLESSPTTINGRQVNEITKSELFECSIVTIPANQDAIRIKDHIKGAEMEDKIKELTDTVVELKSDIEGYKAALESKAGRALSKATERKVRTAVEALQDVLKAVEGEDETEEDEKVDDRVGLMEIEIQELSEKIEALTKNRIKLNDYLAGEENE